VLCPRCSAEDGSAIPFGAEGRAWLERLLYARMAEVPELGMPSAAIADCFALVRSFVAFHVPARLRALDFYASISPIG
jgi:hypothetical protein